MGEKKLRKYLTPKEFQEHIADWSIDTLKRRIKDEGFPAIQDASGILIPTEEAELWFKRRKK